MKSKMPPKTRQLKRKTKIKIENNWMVVKLGFYHITDNIKGGQRNEQRQLKNK
jgi:hypothetical protein